MRKARHIQRWAIIGLAATLSGCAYFEKIAARFKAEPAPTEGAKADAADPKRNELHRAASNLAVGAARKLLELPTGLDLRNAQDSKGRTPLYLAITTDKKVGPPDEEGTPGDKLGMLAVLMAADPDAALADTEGRTPLHMAARAGRSDLVFAILGAPSDKPAEEAERTVLAAKLLKMEAKLGMRPLHFAAMESESSVADRIKVAEKLISEGANANARATNGARPLHLAAGAGYDLMVGKLLELGASKDARMDGKGELDELGDTAFHQAARNGNPKLATVLLEYEADANAQNHEGMTPLHIAAREGYWPFAQILLDDSKAKTDPNIPDAKGRTPLHYAVQSAAKTGKLGILESLLGKEGLEANPKGEPTLLRVLVEAPVEGEGMDKAQEDTRKVGIADRLLKKGTRPDAEAAALAKEKGLNDLAKAIAPAEKPKASTAIEYHKTTITTSDDKKKVVAQAGLTFSGVPEQWYVVYFGLYGKAKDESGKETYKALKDSDGDPVALEWGLLYPPTTKPAKWENIVWPFSPEDFAGAGLKKSTEHKIYVACYVLKHGAEQPDKMPTGSKPFELTVETNAKGEVVKIIAPTE